MGLFTRSDAAPLEAPPFAGLSGLESADPGELAVRVFLTAFTAEQRPHSRPELVLGVLQELGGLSEIPRATVRGVFTTPSAKYALDPLYLQCVLLWERALVAGRLSRGGDGHHHVVLLPLGRRTLLGAEPEAALRRIIGGGG